MRRSIERKVKKIKDLIKELNNYNTIALVNLEGMPSKQLQKLRHELGSKLNLFITTKNNIIRALKDSKEAGIKDLINQLEGSCCIGLSNEDPFKLSLMLQQKKTPSPARAGQTAPNDIIVKAGPTQFVPGPVITDLANVGIKTKVDKGKLTITDDAVIAKEGGLINPLQASIMARLGLTPMSTGLALISVYENNRVYVAKELIIDVEHYKSQISKAYSSALNLAFNAEITIPQVIESLIQYANMQAGNLAFNACIFNNSNIELLLLKGSAQAKALAGKINWEVK